MRRIGVSHTPCNCTVQKKSQKTRWRDTIESRRSMIINWIQTCKETPIFERRTSKIVRKFRTRLKNLKNLNGRLGLIDIAKHRVELTTQDLHSINSALYHTERKPHECNAARFTVCHTITYLVPLLLLLKLLLPTATLLAATTV